MRPAWCLVSAIVVQAACGGGADDGGGTWEEVPGLASRNVHSLQVTSDGDVVMLVGTSDPLFMRWDGSTLTPITPSVPASHGFYRLFSGPTGDPYLISVAAEPRRTQYQRIEGATTVAVGPTIDSIWGGVAGDGGVLGLGWDTKELLHLAPGATEWTVAPPPRAGFDPFGPPAYTSDGAIHVPGVIGTGGAASPPWGIVRIASDASSSEVVLDCQRQEFLFCGSHTLLATGGPPSADLYLYHLADPTLYRFDGATLTPIGAGPLDDLSFITEIVQGRNGDFYLTAASSNDPSATRYLHKLVDGTWKQISAMPGHGSIAVDSDGVVYAGMSPLGPGPAKGGFWILR